MNIEDARGVLRLLTAAYPTYPVADDTAALYLELLVEKVPDPTIGYTAVAEWVTRELVFPKPAELLASCEAEASRRENRARAIAAGQRNPIPGQVACRECDDVGLVFTERARPNVGDTVTEVAPCPGCRSSEAQYWRDGHFLVDHDVHGCDHPRCERRAKAGSGRRRNG